MKEVYDKQWNKIMEAIIRNDAHRFTSSILPTSLSRRVQTCPKPKVKSREKRSREWLIRRSKRRKILITITIKDDLHSCRANWDVSPVIDVQRLPWDNWYTQFHRTLYDHGMTHYNAHLWTYMTQMEWDFLAPRESNWRSNWRG